MTKRKKDEPGAAALRGGDTFARLAKSAEKPPRLVPRELREAGPKRRTRGTQDKSEATSAPETAGTESEGGAGERLSGKEKQDVGRMESPPGCLRNASPAALRNRPRVALPTVPLPVFPVAPAGTVAASPAAPAIQGTPVKKVRLAEALRSSGLDELTVAQNYVVVVEKLRGGAAGVDGTQKMLVDVLKECSRILEPPKSPGGGASDVPTVVNLYHNVPRPVRDLQRDAPQPSEQAD